MTQVLRVMDINQLDAITPDVVEAARETPSSSAPDYAHQSDHLHTRTHTSATRAGPGGPGLTPGLVIAIEPMLQAVGRDDYRHCSDGRGVRTADGSWAAHIEHTVAITAAGPIILTGWPALTITE